MSSGDFKTYNSTTIYFITISILCPYYILCDKVKSLSWNKPKRNLEGKRVLQRMNSLRVPLPTQIDLFAAVAEWINVVFRKRRQNGIHHSDRNVRICLPPRVSFSELFCSARLRILKCSLVLTENWKFCALCYIRMKLTFYLKP